jgi:hydrogenase maturation protease
VDVVNGGLAGLDLLRFVEGAERVVFVDAVTGFGRSGEVVVFRASEAVREPSGAYDHSAGLAYLLRVLPEVCEGAVPGVFVVGIEGNPDDGAIEAAADISLRIAVRGHGACSGG